jgi:hypothetical protein
MRHIREECLTAGTSRAGEQLPYHFTSEVDGLCPRSVRRPAESNLLVGADFVCSQALLLRRADAHAQIA